MYVAEENSGARIRRLSVLRAKNNRRTRTQKEGDKSAFTELSIKRSLRLVAVDVASFGGSSKKVSRSSPRCSRQIFFFFIEIDVALLGWLVSTRIPSTAACTDLLRWETAAAPLIPTLPIGGPGFRYRYVNQFKHVDGRVLGRY